MLSYMIASFTAKNSTFDYLKEVVMTKAEFLRQLGLAIAKQRVKQKLTQTEVAYKCDFERGNLTRIEKGKANVTAETLLKISEAIQVPVSKFFSFQSKTIKKEKEK